MFTHLGERKTEVEAAVMHDPAPLFFLDVARLETLRIRLAGGGGGGGTNWGLIHGQRGSAWWIIVPLRAARPPGRPGPLNKHSVYQVCLCIRLCVQKMVCVCVCVCV